MGGVMGEGLRLQSLDDVLSALSRSSVLIELAVLALCLVLAWLLLKGLRRALPAELEWPVLMGRRLIDGALFPLILLVLAYAAQSGLKAAAVPLFAIRIFLPVLLSLALSRVGVKVLQVAFKRAPLVRLLERSISWLAGLAVALWLTGLLPLLRCSLLLSAAAAAGDDLRQQGVDLREGLEHGRAIGRRHGGIESGAQDGRHGLDISVNLTRLSTRWKGQWEGGR